MKKIEFSEYKERMKRLMTKQMGHINVYMEYLTYRPWFLPLFEDDMFEFFSNLSHNAKLYNRAAVGQDTYYDYYIDEYGKPSMVAKGVDPDTDEFFSEEDEEYEKKIDRMVV